MGLFSYICPLCEENIKLYQDDEVKLFLIKNGEVIESMQGEYDGYGRVLGKEWTSMEWEESISLHFDPSNTDGYCAIHTRCLPSDDYQPLTRSKDDPTQGGFVDWE